MADTYNYAVSLTNLLNGLLVSIHRSLEHHLHSSTTRVIVVLNNKLVNLTCLQLEVHTAVATCDGVPAVDFILAIEEEAEALVTLNVESVLLIYGRLVVECVACRVVGKYQILVSLACEVVDARSLNDLRSHRLTLELAVTKLLQLHTGHGHRLISKYVRKTSRDLGHNGCALNLLINLCHTLSNRA